MPAMHGNASAGAEFPTDDHRATHQQPAWLLEFVRLHRADGVVGKIIFIDPDFPDGQARPAWATIL